MLSVEKGIKRLQINEVDDLKNPSLVDVLLNNAKV